MLAPSPFLSWLLNLLDVYFAGPNLIWVAFLEAVMIAFAYGVATFVEDLVEMTRLAGLRRAAPLFYVFYYVLTPGALGGVSPHTLYVNPQLLIMTLLEFKWLTTKSGAAHFEAWADYIGTALSSPIYLVLPPPSPYRSCLLSLGWCSSSGARTQPQWYTPSPPLHLPPAAPHQPVEEARTQAEQD